MYIGQALLARDVDRLRNDVCNYGFKEPDKKKCKYYNWAIKTRENVERIR